MRTFLLEDLLPQALTQGSLIDHLSLDDSSFRNLWSLNARVAILKLV